MQTLMKKALMVSVVAGSATAFAGVANAAFVLPLSAAAAAGNNGVQIEDNSSPFFMNAQGDDDAFAEFYVMEFDLSGYSGIAVDKVEIDLTHSEPFFAATGGVSIDYTTDDATDLTTLVFDTNSTGGNNGQLTATDVADFTFNAGNDGSTFTYTLADNGGLFADIESQGIVRLILEATDSGTAATYNGFDSNSAPPVLTVTAIPEPATIGLLSLGGLLGLRRSRRA